MLQGTVVENSLVNPEILKNLSILKSWPDGSWNLHQVSVTRDQAIALGEQLAEGAWYMHFWEPGNDNVLVVFKGKSFDIKHSDKTTWSEAVQYGKSIGIPDEQLDFLIY